jgi:hypothetical protein
MEQTPFVRLLSVFGADSYLLLELSELSISGSEFLVGGVSAISDGATSIR